MYKSLEGRNGSVPEWPKGADCKSVDNVYGGSNPPAPTKKSTGSSGAFLFLNALEDGSWHITYLRI